MNENIDPGTGLPMTPEEVAAQEGVEVEAVKIEENTETAPVITDAAPENTEAGAPEAPVEAPAENPTE